MFRVGDIVRSTMDPNLVNEWKDVTGIVLNIDCPDHVNLRAINPTHGVNNSIRFNNKYLMLEYDSERILAIAKLMEDSYGIPHR